jgi:O-antigen/teichoic acid export membrane protein
MSSLKKQALHGAFWSFAERFGQQGIQFVVSIILARLLTPAAFGIVGMLTIFFALAHAFIDSGFSQALIWKQDTTRRDESTVFWFNVAIAIGMALLLALCAPWISLFFREPLLTPMVRVMAGILIIDSLGNVQNAQLQKNLQFGKRMIAMLVSIVVSGIVGLGMALKGYGVWSLVGLQVSASISRVGMLWFVGKWSPLFVFDRRSFHTVLDYGGKLLGSSLLDTAATNLYAVIIGRLYPVAELGLYNRALRFRDMGCVLISQAVTQVQFPILSKIHNDPDRLRKGFLRVFKLTNMLIIPIMIGMGVAAQNLVPVLLGDQWLGVVPYLQILCIDGALRPTNGLNCTLLKIMGRTDLFFRLEVIKKIIFLAFASFCWIWGVKGLLWGSVAASILCVQVNGHYTKKLLNLSLIEQVFHIRGVLFKGLGVGLGVLLISYLPLSYVIKLALQICVGAVLYLLMLWVFRDHDFMEFIHAGLRFMNKKQQKENKAD